MKLRNLKLQTKLTVLFTLVAVVPLTVTALLTSSSVNKEFRESTSKEMSSFSELILSEFQRRGEEVSNKVKRIAENLELKRLLFECTRSERPSASLHDLMNVNERLAKESELGLLELVDSGGNILANFPDAALFHTKDKKLPVLAASFLEKPVLTLEEGLRTRGLSIKVARTIPEFEPKTFIMGGFLVNNDFIARFPFPTKLQVFIISPSEETIYSNGSEQSLGIVRSLKESGIFSSESPLLPASQDIGEISLATGTYFCRELSLRSIGQRVPAKFIVLSSRKELDSLLAKIRLLFLLLTLFGCALSLLLGFLFSRRITQPIMKLASGLEKVSKGELNLSLEEDRHDELGRLTESFNRMTRDLKQYKENWLRAERIAVWQEMARRLAHEIKNPLSPIRISIENLRKTYYKKHPDFSKIFEESTGVVLEEVDKLKKIVDSFSEFARLPKPTKSRENLEELITKTLNLFAGTADKYKLSYRKSSREIWINLDPDQIHRILINLIKNSMEAMPSGGEITIETEGPWETGYATIRLRDNGPGMPEEILANLFKPYLSTKQGGTGLGLAISHRIVTEHGGTLEAENIEGGGGARFTLRLPAAEEASIV
jgi:nitrogen fixation/metabolism regulation signal transduction histidine kinase